MRINPKVFAIANESEPVDVQEFDGRKVELFMMDDYPQVKEEFLNKGKFAVWSSVDGVNYRVFIESGYYNELKPLYAQPINKIWVDFWDTCEGISRKMTRYFIIPITLLAIGGCIGFNFLPKGSIYAMIAVVVVAFGALMFCNRYSRKKIYDANAASVELIKKSLGGAKEFDEILDRQKNYMDQYYENLYPNEDEDLDENLEEADAPQAELPSEEVQPEKSAEVIEAEIVEEKDNE